MKRKMKAPTKAVYIVMRMKIVIKMMLLIKTTIPRKLVLTGLILAKMVKLVKKRIISQKIQLLQAKVMQKTMKNQMIL